VTAVLAVAAADLEARRLARALELPPLDAPFPAWGRGGLRLGSVGVGASRIQARWAVLADGLDGPLVIAAGVCGALVPGLRRGDLVVPERVLGENGWLDVAVPARLRAAADRAGVRAHGGAMVTSAEVVGAPAAKEALHRRTGAVAVDMESAVVLAAAATARCPAAVVRGVSDEVGASLPPELVDLLAPDGGLRRRRAALLAARRPAMIPRALALGRSTARALDAVARVLEGLAA
jgi:hypothetical protein